MLSTPPPQAPAASRATAHLLTRPNHANAQGHVHGGEIMKLADETGAIAAMRHSRCPCVTVAVDSMTFERPVRVGDLLTCEANITWVGNSAMEVRVQVHAENPLEGTCSPTNSAFFVYVALDPQGRPTAVPALLLETAEEQATAEAGRIRQAERRARRTAAVADKQPVGEAPKNTRC